MRFHREHQAEADCGVLAGGGRRGRTLTLNSKKGKYSACRTPQERVCSQRAGPVETVSLYKISKYTGVHKDRASRRFVSANGPSCRLVTIARRASQIRNKRTYPAPKKAVPMIGTIQWT
jgi:hypothetical protein